MHYYVLLWILNDESLLTGLYKNYLSSYMHTVVILHLVFIWYNINTSSNEQNFIVSKL